MGSSSVDVCIGHHLLTMEPYGTIVLTLASSGGLVLTCVDVNEFYSANLQELYTLVARTLSEVVILDLCKEMCSYCVYRRRSMSRYSREEWRS